MSSDILPLSDEVLVAISAGASLPEKDDEVLVTFASGPTKSIQDLMPEEPIWYLAGRKPR